MPDEPVSVLERSATRVHGYRFALRVAERGRVLSRALLELRGATMLLEQDAPLRASLSVRNTYLDPLHLLQAELLARYRKAPDDDTARALKVTMAGISSGLRNTG